MVRDYYEKLLGFLPYKTERLDENIILAKEEELGVKFPQAMIDFYYYFGKCVEILNNGFFLNLDDIHLFCDDWFRDGIVFAECDKEYYGITIDEISSKFRVQVKPKNDNLWCNNYSVDSYFFNEACFSVLNKKPFSARCKIDSDVFKREILNRKFLYDFTEDKNISEGCWYHGCHNEDNNIIGCFCQFYNDVFISAETKEDLEKFIHSADLNFEIIDKNAVSKIKKPKLKKIDNNIVSDCYVSLEKFLPDTLQKLDEKIIRAKAEKLGVEFPQSMIKFYHYFGKYQSILDSFFIFEKLENIHISNNVIVFGYSSQGQTVFGFDIDGLKDEEPCISEFQNEDCKEPIDIFSGNAFFFNVACGNIVETMPSIAVVTKSEKYFFSKILNKKYVYSFSEDKTLNRGYYICGCHDEENCILGCYISNEDNQIYLSAKDDKTLSDFLKITNWQFDRL